jgi:hypothetical protein
MATSEVVQQRRIMIDDFAMDFLQLADGSYGLSSSQLAKLLGVSSETLLASISRHLQNTEGAAQTISPQLSLVGESSSSDTSVSVVSIGDVASLVTFLQTQTREGNGKAQQLFQALAARALETYMHGVFSSPVTDEAFATSLEPELQTSARDSQEDCSPDPVWAAYEASKQERQEVYRRLAES